MWLWWLQVQVLLSTQIKNKHNYIWASFFNNLEPIYKKKQAPLNIYNKLLFNHNIDFEPFETSNKNLIINFLYYYTENKKNYTITKHQNIVYIYIYMCLHSYINTFNLLTNDYSTNYNTLLLNNKKNQLFVSILKNGLFFKAFSTGYILTYLELIKKSLKRQSSSYILLLKTILKMIENFFIKDLFLFNIVGTKKNFFKWLNFLKIKTNNLKVMIYIYTPSVFQTPIKIKKAKSIKKRLKKKYLYSENMI